MLVFSGVSRSLTLSPLQALPSLDLPSLQWLALQRNRLQSLEASKRFDPQGDAIHPWHVGFGDHAGRPRGGDHGYFRPSPPVRRTPFSICGAWRT